jgi:hypothetical protein
MNKLDPFEGDEEGSDGEANPPAPVPDTDNQLQQQQQQLPQVYNALLFDTSSS